MSLQLGSPQDRVQSESKSSNGTLGPPTVQCQPWQQQQSDELTKCSEFVRATCGCSKANGKPCSTLFSEEHYADLRAQAAFLTHEQLDLVILRSVMATIHTDDSILRYRSKVTSNSLATLCSRLKNSILYTLVKLHKMRVRVE